MKRLLLVRHGETEWNAARRLQGQTDIGLSPRGEQQVRALRPLVEALRPGLALSSDLARATATAALLGHETARPTGGLREQSLGLWEGREIAEIRAQNPGEYQGWRAGTFVPPQGESWDSFRTRVRAALDMALGAQEDTVLLTCHGGVIRAALDSCLSLPPSRVIPVGPASLTVLALAGADIRLEAFNVRGQSLDLDAPD